MNAVNLSWQHRHRRPAPRTAESGVRVAFITAILFSHRLEAATKKLYPIEDTWINSCVSGSDVNYGREPDVRVRTAALWGDIKNGRTLLRFDLSDLPVDPSLITKWTLGMYYYAYHWDNPSGRVYNVHRVTRSWEELVATWRARYRQDTGAIVWWDSYLAGTPLYRPGGGDFEPTEYASAELPATGHWMTWDVTDLVGEWISDEHPNKGLLIKDACEFGHYSGYDVAWGPAQFRSVDYWNEDHWPYLEMTFDLPGDFDDDGDIDLDDFAHWEDCMTGPDNGPCDDQCSAFDFDDDTDVDMKDFAALQEGPGW